MTPARPALGPACVRSGAMTISGTSVARSARTDYPDSCRSATPESKTWLTPGGRRRARLRTRLRARRAPVRRWRRPRPVRRSPRPRRAHPPSRPRPRAPRLDLAGTTSRSGCRRCESRCRPPPSVAGAPRSTRRERLRRWSRRPGGGPNDRCDTGTGEKPRRCGTSTRGDRARCRHGQIHCWIVAITIPKDRYVSAEFAALEHERLWPRVWQIACTVDHVAEPGDWFEYRAGWISVLIVRGDDGELRAFQNVCRHRGNSLCEGSGVGLDRAALPVPPLDVGPRGPAARGAVARRTSARSTTTTSRCSPVQVDVWGRLVFVNLDRDADAARRVPRRRPGRRRVGRPRRVPLRGHDATRRSPCNWKVVADGFSETYHVQGIHREMLGSMDDINAPQHVWGRQSVSYQHYGVPSPRLGRDVTDQACGTRSSSPRAGAWARSTSNRVRCRRSPTGQTIRDVIADAAAPRARERGTASTARTRHRADAAAGAVQPVPERDRARVGRDGERAHRPAGSDARRRGDGDVPAVPRAPKPARHVRTRSTSRFRPTATSGSCSTPTSASWQPAQRGLHQPGLTHLTSSRRGVPHRQHAPQPRAIPRHRAERDPGGPCDSVTSRTRARSSTASRSTACACSPPSRCRRCRTRRSCSPGSAPRS